MGNDNGRLSGAEVEALVARVTGRHDWTITELARELRVTPRTVRYWGRLGVTSSQRARLEQLLAEEPQAVDLRAVRTRLGLTQKQLAKRLDVAPRSVARWEVGQQRVPARIRAALHQLADGAPNPIRATRERLGVTQLELARRLGVSPARVSQWERGAAVPAEYERALAALEPDDADAPQPESLRRCREELGLSIRQLATRIGCQPARLSEWERGVATAPPEMRAPLQRELGGAKAPTASRDAEVRALVSREPGQSLAQLLERFPAHDAGAVKGSLQRHVCARRLFRAKRVLVDRTGRPRLVWLYYAQACDGEPTSVRVTGSLLRASRKKRGWTQGSLASALGVSREAVRAWEQRGELPIPPARMRAVIELLHGQEPPVRRRPRDGAPSVLPDLRERRLAVGLTQAELAERLGLRRGQAAVSVWERGEARLTESAAELIVEMLAAAAPERVTPDELRAGRERAGWTQGALAERLGVKPARLWRWERGRSPIPSRLWPAIRATLQAAPEAQRGEPMHDLRGRREGLRWSQRELAEQLGVWQSDVSRWERAAPVPPDIRERLELVLDTGVPAADPAEARRAAILALVGEEAGLSPKRVMQRVGGSWDDVRSAIDALRGAGEVHVRATRYLDGAGRERWRPGLYVGPATGPPAPTLSPTELVRQREELGWSQAELARRLGVKQTIVWRWEHGVTVPAPQRITEIEQVFASGFDEASGDLGARLSTIEQLLAPTRARLALSVSEMARRLGVDRGTYAAWETGKRPVSSWRRRSVLAALAQLEAAVQEDGAAAAT